MLTKKWHFLTDEELFAVKGQTLVFDVESYTNYFLAAFKLLGTNKVVTFYDTGSFNVQKLAWVIKNFCLVGFNCKQYDIIILSLAICGWQANKLFEVTQQIIVEEMRGYQLEKKYNFKIVAANMVDLIEVAPLRGSLKLYAARLHCKKMQDLPFEPTRKLTFEETEIVYDYCLNDLDNTDLLATELTPQLNLRHAMSLHYGVDLRSKSDAQIAEEVIASELTKLLGKRPERPTIAPGTLYPYIVPSFISYQHSELVAMLEKIKQAAFEVDDNGNIIMPKEIEGLTISIGACNYKMGIGGLHSKEERLMLHAIQNEILLIDRDVASYYPYIVLNLKLFPVHLGFAFLEVYRKLVETRIQAKKDKNDVIADSLKITINGCFGKLGSKWSLLYSPDLLIQVTVTGQLCLLMLIDMLESVGISVVSANTDGVLIKCRTSDEMLLAEIVARWEEITNFKTEEGRYKSIYSRDVNNYIAVKEDQSAKVKGCFSDKGSAGNSSLSRNPESFISNDAVIALITKGVPIETTICACRNICRFVNVRNVKGGALHYGTYLGRVVRYYYSVNMQEAIYYSISGNKVAMSDGAMPLMELPDQLPTDIDYQRYIDRAKSILVDIGYSPMPIKGFKPDFKSSGLFSKLVQ